MPPPAATPSVSTADFERRRQARETANEQVVSGIVVGVLAILLGTELFWSDLAAVGFGNFRGEFEIPVQVRWATMATLVCHACLFVFLRLRPRSFAARKYLIVGMRMACLGGVCWGEWYSPRPEFALMVPTAFFALVIVLAGLSYSRSAVLCAGGLAVATYATVTLLGPMWPLSLRATGLATQVFIAVSVVTWHIVSTMRTMTAEAVSNERLSRFFSPEIAARIATEPEITVRAAECRVTVLFSDISGFTSMASHMRPQEVVDLLNAYFPRMVQIIFKHGGTLEKFVGDAVLAVWGAPVERLDDADRAVTAALEMQAAVNEFNAARAPRGEAPISVHIGIASGLAAAGYIGTDSYIQYAVIGDTTNVASRICSAAGPGEILVGEETRSRISPGVFRLESLPPIAAKGKDQPVPVHRLRPPA
ncbi:MAG: adenylate/guanylate cyclase domain-containing protein [Planctomycetia bacterium]|nr:adenylate/guanylate cyclase domain-containing protein [Planctomycetia bacterium]